MKKIAILLENLFDEQELIYPYHRLREDFEVELVGTKADTEYQSKAGFSMKSDVASKGLKADDYAGVFIPGGFSPDYMRRSKETIAFVKAMHDAGKPVAAICHAGWVLASALDIEGMKLTSYASIKDDLVHAGANWVDEEVVIDGHLITGRNPDDLPAVVQAFVDQLKEN